jgi:CARDB
VPAGAPAPQFIPYIGDYVHLMTLENDFYGIFSANNTPDIANFPQGVTYQRLADFNTHVLIDLTGQRVPVSIDPFFFRLTPPGVVTFEYAAKFICGIQREPEGTRLARGLYATTINVHNPNDKRARFFKKLALTYPPGAQKPGEVLRIGFDVLAPDQALAVDCEDIQRRLFPNGFPAPYIEGFIVIESPVSLDVTAVYTTAALDRAGRPEAHSSIDVEQVSERRKGGVVGLPDLIPVPDSTGSFCRIRDGQLVVTVRNQGSGLAGPSTTRVDFGAFGVVNVPTQALDPGDSVDVLAAIPPGCFSPDCGFRITVDATSQVTESNEGNNTASGICIG